MQFMINRQFLRTLTRTSNLRVGLVFLACSLNFVAKAPAKDLKPVVRAKVVVEVQGHLLPQSDKKIQLPLKAVANLVYDETRVGANRSERQYHQAETEIEVNKRVHSRKLRSDLETIICERRDGSIVLYSANGPLTRDELELLTVPLTSFSIDCLIPPQKKVGHDWTLDDDQLANLLNLDAVTGSDVKCKVISVEQEIIRGEIAGSVVGSVDGIVCDVEIDGKFRFRRAQGAIDWIAVSINEKRAMGPTTPGFEVTARVRMAREAAPQGTTPPRTLATRAKTAPAENELLVYQPSDSNFKITHNRRWYVASERPGRSILRLVEDGITVAQCNLQQHPLNNEPQMTLKKFEESIKSALSKSNPQIVDASETTNEKGMRILRVLATGTVSNAGVQWIYYHILGEDGFGISCVFTMSTEDADRFAAGDFEITNSIEFVENAVSRQAQQRTTQR